MYIALAVMLVGTIIGRILRNKVPQSIIRHCIMAAIFLLLFLLGVSIGSNDKLFERLPSLGWQAFLLMLFCVAGSIAATIFLKICHLDPQKTSQSTLKDD